MHRLPLQIDKMMMMTMTLTRRKKASVPWFNCYWLVTVAEPWDCHHFLSGVTMIITIVIHFIDRKLTEQKSGIYHVRMIHSSCKNDLPLICSFVKYLSNLIAKTYGKKDNPHDWRKKSDLFHVRMICEKNLTYFMWELFATWAHLSSMTDTCLTLERLSFILCRRIWRR